MMEQNYSQSVGPFPTQANRERWTSLLQKINSAGRDGWSCPDPLTIPQNLATSGTRHPAWTCFHHRDRTCLPI